MMILTIRTDNPEAEIGLYDNAQQLTYETWQAHRQLAETLHTKIAALLQSSNKQLNSLDGIVVFKGPGSFTGLRIGITVANALAYSLNCPVVAAEGPDWIQTGVERLLNNENDQIAMPEYGAPVHITLPKH